MKYIPRILWAVFALVLLLALLRHPSQREQATTFCNETGGKIVMVGYDKDSGLMLNCIYPESIVPAGEM